MKYVALIKTLPIVLAAAAGDPSRAQADILAVATIEGAYTLPLASGGGWSPVVMSGATSTTPAGFALKFATSKDNDRIVISYSTTCLAFGFALYVRANIEGVIASPGAKAGSEVDLCFVTVSGSTYSASRTFSAVVPIKGDHSLAVEVSGPGGAAARLGNSIIVVQD